MGGSAAIQSRPATRATALFTPEARPARESGAEFIALAVRGGRRDGQAKAEQHGHRQYGRPVAGVGADAHGEHGRDRAQQAARH